MSKVNAVDKVDSYATSTATSHVKLPFAARTRRFLACWTRQVAHSKATVSSSTMRCLLFL